MTKDASWAYDLEITLVEGEGVCAAKHKIAEVWTWKDDPEKVDFGMGMCVHALNSMLPKLPGMRSGVCLPWLKDDPDAAMHLCPDVASSHVFRIRRIKTGE